MDMEKDNSKLSSQNRRNFFRVSAQLSMQYRVLRSDGVSSSWNSTFTKNISAAGLCFESFHPLGLNNTLEINLSLPFLKTPAALKARIVRASEIKLGEVYGVAASFTEVKKSDREKLQKELEQIDISGLL